MSQPTSERCVACDLLAMVHQWGQSAFRMRFGVESKRLSGPPKPCSRHALPSDWPGLTNGLAYQVQEYEADAGRMMAAAVYGEEPDDG